MTSSILFAMAIAVAVGPATGARASAQAVGDHGAFILTTAGDTIVIERFDRVADTLRGSVAVKGQPRVDYRAVLLPGDAVQSLTLDVFPGAAVADAPPARSIRIRMHGDSAFAATGGSEQGFATVTGAIPLMNNSFALAELFTRRARKAGGAADLSAWALSGGSTIPVKVRAVGGDSMSIDVAGQQQRLRVDRTGRILGGIIVGQPVRITRVSPDVAAGIRLGQPDYSAPAGAPYHAVDVTLAGQGGIPLGGTLTLPNDATGPLPAVVTITGSGQQDRDEYISIVPGGYRLFRQVADTLGRRGIAVLRLDDRMIGRSGGTPGTSADYADDIRAAVAFLRARPDIDGRRIALIGHSEGGMIAPMVAATDPALRGIVLLAGPADRGSDVIHYQQREAIDHGPALSPAGRDSAIRAAAVALDTLAARDAWLRFFVGYDPLLTARRVRVPTLILQGATDHQVTPDQAEKLAGAMRAGGNTDVTVRVFPGLDHLFVPDPSGDPSGYTTLKTNRVASPVLGILTDWLSVHLAAHK